jgi:rhodanese-related sulfurtransferase
VEQIDIISEDGSTEVLKGLKLNTVMEVFNNNSAIFIDARDQWEYSDGHISGAINIPEYNFSVDEKIIKTISRDALIVVYCDGDDCDTSKRLANELTKLGFEKCYIFLGGFYEWKEASLPVEKGDINE